MNGRNQDLKDQTPTTNQPRTHRETKAGAETADRAPALVKEPAPVYDRKLPHSGSTPGRKQADTDKPHLVVHGHFYQPPRENPWTGALEKEEGAAPYHDWNRRITEECYEANAWARIVNDRGFIIDMVNNYSLLSFNMGPTLLSWLYRHAHSLVYQPIMEAEHIPSPGRRPLTSSPSPSSTPSTQARLPAKYQLTQEPPVVTPRGGDDPASQSGQEPHSPGAGVEQDGIRRHRQEGGTGGNNRPLRKRALAQAYNHSILPLLSKRDQRTQVRWATREFEVRYGRKPAGIWLPETAINDQVVTVLCEEGIRFTILSPWQVKKVRPIGGTRWRDVEDGTVDPTMPYRIYSPDGSGKFLDVFFYDGQVSQGIGFGDTLSSSREMVNGFDRILARSWRAGSGPPVVNIAVDGETFGHHKAFGDRTLAYALTTEAPARGYHVTSYEEYLDQYAPSWEAVLKPGPNGEGTAWSCAHGVGRWYRDCGCSTGGQPGWTQEWRGPLREALEFLQKKADALYVKEATPMFKDVWAARDDSVDLFIDGYTQENLHRFMARHATTQLGGQDETRTLKLLNLQRMTQHMFTSCGWFFADIAGRESQQVLRYGGKVIDMIVELGGPSPEKEFLRILSKAKSNLPQEGNGAQVFKKHITGLRTTPHRLAAQHAMARFVNVEPLTGQEGHYRIYRSSWERTDAGLLSLQMGRFLLHHRFTGEKFDLATAVLHLGEQHVHTAVGNVRDDAHYGEILDTLLPMLPKAYASHTLQAIDQTVGPSFYTLDTLSPEEKEQVLQTLFKPAMDRIHNVFTFVYEGTREQMEALQKAGMVLPAEYKAVAQFTLGAKLEAEVLAQQGSRNMDAYRKAFQIVRNAREQGLKLDKARVENTFTKMLNELTEQLLDDTSVEQTRNLTEFILLAERLELTIPYQQTQEKLFHLLSQNRAMWGSDPALAVVMEELATGLWLAVGEEQ